MAKSLTITLSNRAIGSVSISNREIGSVTLVDTVADAAPTFTSGPASGNVLSTSFDITATLNENGTVYSYVLLATAGAPTVAQVIANGESAVDSGIGVTISHSGLTAATNYTAYVVAKDTNGNTQTSVTDVDVTTASAYDADAQTWIDAGSFVSANQDILNTFVLNLKTGLTNATNVWSSINGLWVFTWGADSNASNGAINGKTPGTFNLTFVNSPSFASTGCTFNGTSQYARTGVNPTTQFSNYSHTMSVHNSNSSVTALRALMGCSNISSAERLFFVPEDGSGNYTVYCYRSGTRLLSSNGGNTSGLLTNVLRSNGDRELYVGATSVATGSETVSTRPTQEIYLGAENNNGSATSFSNGVLRVAMVGGAMTDNQVADWSAAVTQLFTDLGI